MARAAVQTSETFLNFGEYNAEQARRYLAAFRLAIAVFLVGGAFIARTLDFGNILGAGMITVAGFIPTYLWCSRRALGLPIFPIFAAMHVPFYAFPLLTDHQRTMEYSPESRQIAALTVTIFLILGTIVWFHLVKKRTTPPKRCFSMPMPTQRQHGIDYLMTGLFCTTTLLALATSQGDLDPLYRSLPSGANSIIRTVISGLATVSTFIICIRWGVGQMPSTLRMIFVPFFILNFCVLASSLLLVGTLTLLVPAAIGFALGRNRIPVITMVMFILLLSFMHAGKFQMREVMWEGGVHQRVMLRQYPEFFRIWSSYSWQSLSGENEGGEQPTSLVDRASMMQIMLTSMTMTPDDVPYLNGQTYKIVPILLVPRIIWPDKPTAHEGQAILNVHFRIQTLEETSKTFIAWGLLPESYANFGFAGVIGLALVLGWGLGAATQWTMNVPFLSFRNLIGFAFMFYASDIETVASVMATSFFQTVVVITMFSMVLMRPRPNPYYHTLRTKLPPRSKRVLPIKQTARILPSIQRG